MCEDIDSDMPANSRGIVGTGALEKAVCQHHRSPVRQRKMCNHETI